jgi:DNA-binding NtrC family response regulator
LGAIQRELAEALVDRGWRLEMPPDLAEAGKRLAAEQCAAVLVRLQGAEAERLSKIEELACRYPQKYWVAIVDASLVKEPAIRDLLTAFFWDYNTAPVDIGRLVDSLGHAAGMATLALNGALVSGPAPEVRGLVGHSVPIEDLRRIIAKMAKVDAPVLIVGESGSGKELAARAIHAASRRAEGPFVAVNCAALPPTLIHGELFGHEKGAFTGADKRKIGHFESANGGTIFLDEIGDLPENLQSTLLRVLQEKAIRRLGGNMDLPIDLRIVAATHVNLRKAILEGRFREDLFFRLDVLQLRVPSLRERGDDILLLANHFLSQFNTELRKRIRGFSLDSRRLIAAYRWPGNIRELHNRVYRAAVMCETGVVSPRDMGFEPLARRGKTVMNLERARARAESEAVVAALRESGGDASMAADLLGTSRATLYRLVERHGVRSGPQARPHSQQEDPEGHPEHAS